MKIRILISLVYLISLYVILNQYDEAASWSIIFYFLLVPLSVMISVSKLTRDESLEEIPSHTLALSLGVITAVAMGIIIFLSPYLLNDSSLTYTIPHFLATDGRESIGLPSYFLTTGLIIVGPMLRSKLNLKKEDEEAESFLDDID